MLISYLETLYVMPNSLPLTLEIYPSCVRMIRTATAMAAFQDVVQVLRPNNTETRAVIWAPPASTKADNLPAAIVNCVQLFEMGVHPSWYTSTNRQDRWGRVAGYPHIDGRRSIAPGMPENTYVPHDIRCIYVPFGPKTILYEGILNHADFDHTGAVLYRAFSKLGQAWQIAIQPSVLFVNVGGPPEVQIVHEAALTPQTSEPEQTKRVVMTIDFRPV